MKAKKKSSKRIKAPRKSAQKKGERQLTGMNAAELRAATAEFEREFVADSFAEPTPRQQAQLDRARRKRGRPKVGQGVKVISVSVERGLLNRADRLARKLKVPRATLVSRGLEAVLDGEVTVDE